MEPALHASQQVPICCIKIREQIASQVSVHRNSSVGDSLLVSGQENFVVKPYGNGTKPPYNHFIMGTKVTMLQYTCHEYIICSQ